MVYGDILECRQPTGDDVVQSAFPPRLGAFNFQAALVHGAPRFFEFSTTSWVSRVPSDWNLCRRMLECGVRVGHIDGVVVRWYSSRHHGPASGSVAAASERGTMTRPERGGFRK